MDPDIEAAPLLSESECPDDLNDSDSREGAPSLAIPESSNAPDEGKKSARPLLREACASCSLDLDIFSGF